MTTAYTSLLGFALPVTGELSGTWGDTVNNGITSLLDSAIAGTTTLSADSDVTLTTTQGSSNTAREAILLWTAGGSATRTITAPAQSKIYTVINASSGTQSIILAGAGPTSGVTIAKGESALCAWNGSDFIKISNTAGPGTFTNLTVTGNTSLGDADTDTITQAASYVTGTQLKSAKTATNTLSLAAYDVDGTAYTNLITLTASNTPTLTLTSTGVGTINNMSIGATTASTGAFTTLSASGAVTLSGGTENGVAYLNGSKVLTTGSALVFDGTNLGLGVTPSAWNAGKAIEVGAVGNSIWGNGANNLQLMANAYLNSSFKYAGNGFATNYYQADGVHAWRNAPNNTSGAGATATFTQAMTLDTSGNLGVGTTSPSSFDGTVKTVIGSGSGNPVLTLYGGNATYSGINFADGTTGNEKYRGFFEYDHASDALRIGTTGSTKATIDSSGNFGLGVTPGAWATAYSRKVIQFGPVGSINSLSASTTNNQTYIGSNIINDSGGASRIYADWCSLYLQYLGKHIWQSSSTQTGVVSMVDLMTLDNNGNLGIGTSSITANLQIQRSSPSFWMVETTSGTAQRVEHTISSVGVYNQNLNWNAGSASRAFTWSQGGTENMRIDSSGNLGLGVAPSAWGSITKNIEGGSGSLNFYSTSQLWLTQNAVWNSGWTYKTTDAATSFQQYQGGYYWYQAASGTAGNALTFNQAMTLDASGNLLVGTTSNLGSSGRVQSLQTAQSVAGLSVDATNASFDYKVVYLNTTIAASSAFDFIQCTTGGYGTVQFRVRGDGVIFAQNTTVQSISDARVKENVRDAGEGLQTVLGLRPVRFDFKEGFGNNRKNQLGFIAQEVEAVFSDAVDVAGELDENGDPYKSVGPSAMIPLLVAAIKEQQALITQLTARITALEGA